MGVSPTLNKISLNIQEGSFVTIIGRIGSVKSTVLLSLIGELASMTGSLRLKGKIAYMEQEPVIFPGLVRDNILFGQPYDPEFYEKVIECCCLRDDLNSFPNGDLSEIGEKGINLSGG